MFANSFILFFVDLETRAKARHEILKRLDKRKIIGNFFLTGGVRTEIILYSMHIHNINSCWVRYYILSTHCTLIKAGLRLPN